MKCIIVTEDFSMKKNVEKLIISSDLHLLSTFTTTSEASAFMKNNLVNVMFFDIQMCDFNSIEFIQSIPKKTFVIYIPEFSVYAKDVDREQLSDSTIVKRFQKSVIEARLFVNLIKREKPSIADDYFVI